jgi:NAD dependent epimerase/dehydratase family enzyme
MADELFLSSARVYPQKLLEASFHFKYENLEDALCLSLTQSR